jgi:hypothetical protein
MTNDLNDWFEKSTFVVNGDDIQTENERPPHIVHEIFVEQIASTQEQEKIGAVLHRATAFP